MESLLLNALFVCVCLAKNAYAEISEADEYSMKFYSNVLPIDHNLFHQSSIEESRPLNYCSFFNNRAPSPQINLKNCTWYREDSCCLQSEIESTFSKVILEFVRIN